MVHRGQEDVLSAMRMGNGNGCVHLYDLEQESGAACASGNPDDLQGKQSECLLSGGEEEKDKSTITCNSTPMVRERLGE